MEIYKTKYAMKTNYILFISFSLCIFSCTKEKPITPAPPAEKSKYEIWGIGKKTDKELSLNRDYNWYIDQKETGKYSSINCGPTATTMAAKWYDEKFPYSVEDARSKYRPEGGWWYTNDIESYLKLNKIPHKFIPFKTYLDIEKELSNNCIAILCLDMDIIRESPNMVYRIDKFYKTTPDWGHFIIAKGFIYSDKDKFLEVYDPNSWGGKYNDGTYKGACRYYRCSDILKSATDWWPFAIIIGDNTTTKSQNALNPANIPHQYGK